MKTIHPLLISALLITPVAGILHPGYATEIPTDISQKEKPATIKILLAKEKEKALLEVKGRYFIYDPATGYQLSEGVLNKRSLVYADPAGLKWGERFPSILQMRIVPGDSQSSILVDGIEYKGCVEIYSVQGKLQIINEVDVERYLKATLSADFLSELDDDVMDALAIIARTNAYYLVGRQPNAYWHVDAKEFGYAGYAMALQNVHIDRAINSTRHMILTYNNVPFAATWTKDSAGKTADFASIFRKTASTPEGVAAPFAQKDRAKRGWSLMIPKQHLAKTLGTGKVSGLDLYQDKSSGKVYAIRVQNEHSSQNFDFFSLQKLLGPEKLRSNDFSVKVQGETVVFSGYGEGHGVGLCLYSAIAMAENGANTQKILSAFFPNTKLEKVDSMQTKHP